jgi:hypothetical protein
MSDKKFVESIVRFEKEREWNKIMLEILSSRTHDTVFNILIKKYGSIARVSKKNK